MSDCLFCKIVSREIPAKLAYEDDRMIAIDDINPQAPMHVLVIPKEHIATLNDLGLQHDALVGEMNRRAAAIARERGYGERGFRTVFNTNKEAHQTVFHIHLHVLAGRSFNWPPG
jgi:histidine triad (HIT) family protein